MRQKKNIGNIVRCWYRFEVDRARGHLKSKGVCTSDEIYSIERFRSVYKYPSMANRRSSVKDRKRVLFARSSSLPPSLPPYHHHHPSSSQSTTSCKTLPFPFLQTNLSLPPSLSLSHFLSFFFLSLLFSTTRATDGFPPPDTPLIPQRWASIEVKQFTFCNSEHCVAA